MSVLKNISSGSIRVKLNIDRSLHLPQNFIYHLINLNNNLTILDVQAELVVSCFSDYFSRQTNKTGKSECPTPKILAEDLILKIGDYFLPPYEAASLIQNEDVINVSLKNDHNNKHQSHKSYHHKRKRDVSPTRSKSHKKKKKHKEHNFDESSLINNSDFTLRNQQNILNNKSPSFNCQSTPFDFIGSTNQAKTTELSSPLISDQYIDQQVNSDSESQSSDHKLRSKSLHEPGTSKLTETDQSKIASPEASSLLSVSKSSLLDGQAPLGSDKRLKRKRKRSRKKNKSISDIVADKMPTQCPKLNYVTSFYSDDRVKHIHFSDSESENTKSLSKVTSLTEHNDSDKTIPCRADKRQTDHSIVHRTPLVNCDTSSPSFSSQSSDTIRQTNLQDQISNSKNDYEQIAMKQSNPVNTTSIKSNNNSNRIQMSKDNCQNDQTRSEKNVQSTSINHFTNQNYDKSVAPHNIPNGKIFNRKVFKKKGFVSLSKQEQLDSVNTNISFVYEYKNQDKPNGVSATEKSCKESSSSFCQGSNNGSIKNNVKSTTGDFKDKANTDGNKDTLSLNKFSNLPTITSLPESGDTIVYKILELNRINYIPEVSDYREAIVVSVDHGQNSVQLKVLTRVNREPNPAGKFEMNTDSDVMNNSDVQNNALSNEELVTIEWSNILCPKLLKRKQ